MAMTFKLGYGFLIFNITPCPPWWAILVCVALKPMIHNYTTAAIYYIIDKLNHSIAPAVASACLNAKGVVAAFVSMIMKMSTDYTRECSLR